MLRRHLEEIRTVGREMGRVLKEGRRLSRQWSAGSRTRGLTSGEDWLRVWERVSPASVDGQAPQSLRRESVWRGWQTW